MNEIIEANKQIAGKIVDQFGNDCKEISINEISEKLKLKEAEISQLKEIVKSKPKRFIK